MKVINVIQMTMEELEQDRKSIAEMTAKKMIEELTSQKMFVTATNKTEMARKMQCSKYMVEQLLINGQIIKNGKVLIYKN